MVSWLTRVPPRFAALLMLAACGRSGTYYDSDQSTRYGAPVFAWDSLASCQVPPPSTEATRPVMVHVGSIPMQIGVPEGWAQDQPSAVTADDAPRSWSDPANEAWLAVGQLELDAAIPARDARLYISDQYVDENGHLIVQVCEPCLQITHRCQATIGGRRALVTEGNYLNRTAQMTVLWPQGNGQWLAVEAGATDSMRLPVLRARVRRVEFK